MRNNRSEVRENMERVRREGNAKHLATNYVQTNDIVLQNIFVQLEYSLFI